MADEDDRLEPSLPVHDIGETAPPSLQVLRLPMGDDELAVLSFDVVPAAGAVMASEGLPAGHPALSNLTSAERAVLWQVLLGFGNEEIAAARGTAMRTVAVQVASVFRKLGAHSRSELAAVLYERAADQQCAADQHAAPGSRAGQVRGRRRSEPRT